MAKLPAVIGARVQYALNGVVYFGKIVDVKGDSVVVKPDWADSDKENLFVRNFITSGWEYAQSQNNSYTDEHRHLRM